MRSLTIRKKLLGMTAILVLMLAGLSLFFINRFSVVTDSYQNILLVRVPQERVATLMKETLLGLRINLNEIVGVERNENLFGEILPRIREKLRIFNALQEVTLQGSVDLGKIIPGEKGLSVPPCRQGGAIERLTKEASEDFKSLRAVTTKILDKQRQYLEITNAVGWYDSQENCKGAVKKLVETGRRLEQLATETQSKLLVMEIRRQEKNLIERADQRYIDRLLKAIAQLSNLSDGELKNLTESYHSTFKNIFERILLQSALRNELKSLVRKDLRDKQKKLDQAVEEIAQRAHSQMLKNAAEAVAIESSARLLILIVASLVALISVLFGWFISAGINKVLTNTITTLNEGADQVVAASSQVSGSSQSLAQGASEQAASLEETAASLEEIGSMSTNNADNADQANSLMKDVSTVVSEANQSMAQLTDSMEEISKSSEEIAKIIKTIDEIAFQTNLLALNAAVEAARAGEHGNGFAVVADEVRNLAMRAGEAAKNTAILIEDNMEKVRGGSSVVSQTNTAFQKVAESAAKVAELVGEIAAASTEQAQGVEQINQAMSEMDKVIQANAANAEESASASEELNAQAEQMKEMVAELMKLVGAQSRDRAGLIQVNDKVARPKALPYHSPQKYKPTTESGKEAAQRSERIIPLEEKDFRSF